LLTSPGRVSDRRRHRIHRFLGCRSSVITCSRVSVFSAEASFLQKSMGQLWIDSCACLIPARKVRESGVKVFLVNLTAQFLLRFGAVGLVQLRLMQYGAAPALAPLE